MRIDARVRSLLCIAAAGAAPAQNLVTGSVVDAAGQPVAGYPVVIENADTIARGMSDIVGVTAADGNFTVVVPEPGQYKVVLPTQPEAVHSFDVQQTEHGGLLAIFGAQKTFETKLGKISLD